MASFLEKFRRCWPILVHPDGSITPPPEGHLCEADDTVFDGYFYVLCACGWVAKLPTPTVSAGTSVMRHYQEAG